MHKGGLILFIANEFLWCKFNIKCRLQLQSFLGEFRRILHLMGDANLKEWLARMHLITIENCNIQEETREKIVPDVVQMEGTSLGST